MIKLRKLKQIFNCNIVYNYWEHKKNVYMLYQLLKTSNIYLDTNTKLQTQQIEHIDAPYDGWATQKILQIAISRILFNFIQTR